MILLRFFLVLIAAFAVAVPIALATDAPGFLVGGVVSGLFSYVSMPWMHGEPWRWHW